MGSTYIVHFIETGEEFAYTTVTAVCEAFDKEEINVSRPHLSTVLSDKNIYKNKKVIIKKFTPLTAKEVRNQKKNKIR